MGIYLSHQFKMNPQFKSMQSYRSSNFYNNQIIYLKESVLIVVELNIYLKLKIKKSAHKSHILFHSRAWEASPTAGAWPVVPDL